MLTSCSRPRRFGRSLWAPLGSVNGGDGGDGDGDGGGDGDGSDDIDMLFVFRICSLF